MANLMGSVVHVVAAHASLASSSAHSEGAVRRGGHQVDLLPSRTVRVRFERPHPRGSM